MDTSPILETLVISLLMAPVVFVTALYLIEEDGPFNIFRHIRWLAGHRIKAAAPPDEDGQEQVEYLPNHWVTAQVISCSRCLPPWVSLFWLAVLGIAGLLPSNVILVIIIWLSTSGAAVYAFEHTSGGYV